MYRLPSLSFLLLLLLHGCGTEVDRAPGDKLAPGIILPNIVLVVADDHGKDALGCYGNPVIQTPNLDRLAATATRFDRAFCTTASCSASRSVILTGLHNHANGQFGHEHSFHHFRAFDHVKSLPVLLESAGYRTGHVGKFHVGPEEVFRFQHRFKANARSPREMVAEVEKFVAAPEDKPFFLFFCTSDPHRSGRFAEDLPHAPDDFGNRPEGYPDIEEITYDPAEVLVPPFLSDTPETRAEIAQYYQSVSRLDEGVGGLMDILVESGQWENTLFVYISDNGMAFPGAKTTLYEAGMQLPCIVKLPEQRTGRSSDELVSWTDLVPSFLEAAKINADSLELHGQSLLPAAAGRRLDRREVFASHTFHEITMYYPMRVVRGEKYKLIMNVADGLAYPFASDLYESKTWQSVLDRELSTLGQKPITEFLRRPRFELYDVETDPYEIYNLAADPSYAEVLTGMQRQLLDFQRETGDPWVTKWTYE